MPSRPLLRPSPRPRRRVDVPRRRTPAGRRMTALVAVAPLLLGAVACTADEEPSRSESSSEAPSEAGTEQDRSLPEGVARTSVRVGQVAGQLPRAQRRTLVGNVGRVVDGWFERAWLAERPARGGRAFPAFSLGARALAKRDASVLTATRIGGRVDAVVPRHRSVALDVLAPGGRVAAVTARFRLGLTPYVGTRAQDRVVVSGRLMLTRAADRRWQVVGYDVATTLPDRPGAGRDKADEKRDRAEGKRDRADGKREKARQRAGQKTGKAERKDRR